MKEPISPYPPHKYEYETRVERQYIYRYCQSLREDDYDDDDDDDEDEMDEYANLPTKDLHEVNLQWLITQIPPGLKPKDIKIEFGYNANDMAFEDHYVNFYHEVKIPARKAKYKADLAKYGEDLKK